MRIPHPLRALTLALALGAVAPAAHAAASLYIVQAQSTADARASVLRVHGTIQSDLSIIHAVAARLDAQQSARLRAIAGVRLFEDRKVAAHSLLGGLTQLLSTTTNSLNQTLATTPLVSTVTSTAIPLVTTVTGNPLTSTVTAPLVSTLSAATGTQDGKGVLALTLTYQTNYPMLVGADTLQQAGVTGKGVTIAVLDSGLWQDVLQNYGSRILATRDVTNGGTGPVTGDPYGHGTHVASIAAGGAQNIAGQYLSIAPGANLVIVRALDGDGAGSYTDIIAGINWIVANRQKYNIRVLNLSLGATPQSYYWDDPLDQAVMAAWKAGIVVVTAAGNDGPSAMTIDVPGNVPYVVTVGALTDNYQPYNTSDWRLASFSSTGPTYEGFVKPE
ncbi:MAG: S8 family serine peptidase, partial [Steroidobacteraceae bacterium]